MTPTTLLRAALAAALLFPAPAHAEPPEGCTGFPDIPQAYLCVDQWSPENAVPSVTPGPGQTVEIPEFCVFGECTGPTPVTVPSFVVTQGNGVVAVITYNGTTHTVTVPPIPDPNALVQQVVQTVNDLVAQVLGIVEDAASQPVPGTFNATASFPCWGCGVGNGNLSGSFSGVINGVTYNNAPMSGSFTHNSAACPMSSTASGIVNIGGQSANFTWTQFADLLTLTFSGGFNGTGEAVFFAVGPSNPCGGPAIIPMTGTITTA